MRTLPRVLVAVTVALSATCAGDRRGVQVLADPALAGALDDVARERVARGGADAGIAGATDVGPGVRAGVRVLDLPERVSIRGVYAIVLAADPPHPTRAAEFVEFALSAEGRRILAARGFGPP